MKRHSKTALSPASPRTGGGEGFSVPRAGDAKSSRALRRALRHLGRGHFWLERSGFAAAGDVKDILLVLRGPAEPPVP